jgi:preprotein translocase subunit SecG
MITKFFIIAMVLGVMSNKGDVVVSSDNIPKGLQVSCKKSINFLDLVVEP